MTLGLRSRFSLAIGLAVLGVAGSMAAATFRLERRRVLENVATSERTAVENWKAVCAQAFALQSDLLTINFSKVLAKSPGVAYAYLVERSGRILVHTDPRFIRRDAAEWKAARPPEAYELSRLVAVGGRPIGWAVIGFDPAHRRRVLADSFSGILGASLGVAGAGLLVGLLLALGLAELLTRPIRDLARASELVSQGRLDVRVPVRRADELGELAERFNAMTGRLSELDQLKDEFIAMVSHDLRGPLAAVQNYVEALKMGLFGEPNPKQKEAYATMIESTNHLVLFINNVLDLTKLKAGRMEIKARPMALAPVAARVANLFEATSRRKGFALKVDFPPALPQVLAEEARIEQVLTNVVASAVKLTPEEGAIRLGASIDGAWVVVGVRNTSPPLGAEELTGLFEQFDQKRLAPAGRKVTGTGLGLALTKRMVEAHGGRIWAEAAERELAVFFTLPKAVENR